MLRPPHTYVGGTVTPSIVPKTIPTITCPVG